MGARGPAPKPAALRAVDGTGPVNKHEPKPAATLPTCPSWLDRVAKAEWKRVARELHRIGLLTGVDRTVLAAYCSEYSKWRMAEEYLRENGFTFETQNGYVQQRPEVSIAKSAVDNIKKLCSELGMTPSARSRIQLPEMPDVDDILD